MDFKSCANFLQLFSCYFQVMDAETQRQLSEKEHQRSAAVFAAAKQKVGEFLSNNQIIIKIYCLFF